MERKKLGVLIGLFVLVAALVAVILIGRGSGDDSGGSASGEVPSAVIADVSEDLDTRPKLAGSTETPPTIPANSTLVFVVDLEDVQSQ